MWSFKCLFLVFFICFVTVLSQDLICNGEGFLCSEHSQCCEGCCYDGECVDTYRNCYDILEICQDHICIGDEVCVAFQPPQCPACEPYAMCL